jgi:putative ABC transport system permease protein
MISLRLAWREIRNNRSFSLFFVFNLALGLLGFVLLDTFKVALDQSLSQRSQVLLSADLAVSARRPLTIEEDQTLHKLLPAGTREGRLIEMYSMVASDKTSRLAEIAMIDETYPFYGELDLQDKKAITTSSNKIIVQTPSVWIYPELALQLGVKPGEFIKLGDAKFKVDDLITNDSGEVWRGFSLATRVYLGASQVEATHLLRKGSTASWSRLFLLPKDTDVEALAKKLNHELKDPAIQVRTDKNASEEVGRLLGYLNDYLGLVALVALFLAGIGAGYLFRSFLSRRTKEIAILTSLGVTNSMARRIYLLQLGILGGIAALFTCGVATGIFPFASWALTPYLPFPIELHLSLRTAFLTLGLGCFGSILICYPVLMKIKELKPSELFQESANPEARFSKRQLAGAIPGLVVLAGLSFWQAHSFKMGGLFLATFLGSLVLLALSGLTLFSLLSVCERSRNFSLRTSIRNLRRSKLSSIICFIAIGIGMLLLNLIPMIQSSLDAELERPKDSEIPSLFLFDIQDEQLGPLKEYLNREHVQILGLSPLIRSKLSKVNGQDFEKKSADSSFQTREEEQQARSRNRGYNLSYRTEFSKEEQIVSGKPFSGRFDPASGSQPEISLERRFAERLGIHIGDTLEFDIQGLPIEGKVVNFRKVRWTSFQPNFFILFQPGVLDDAPKTYITAIPKLPLENKLTLQNGIVQRFPNVSMIDVSDVTKKILEVFSQMSAALRVMAWLSLFAGFVVLFSISSHQASSRRQETNLLKVLGARFSDIRRMVAVEFAILGLCASALGVFLSYLVSWLITEFLFDGNWIFTWQTPLVSIAAAGFLASATAVAAAWRILRQKPIALLQMES